MVDSICRDTWAPWPRYNELVYWSVLVCFGAYSVTSLRMPVMYTSSIWTGGERGTCRQGGADTDGTELAKYKAKAIGAKLWTFLGIPGTVLGKS